jgi:hypothetical protein
MQEAAYSKQIEVTALQTQLEKVWWQLFQF